MVLIGTPQTTTSTKFAYQALINNCGSLETFTNQYRKLT